MAIPLEDIQVKQVATGTKPWTKNIPEKKISLAKAWNEWRDVFGDSVIFFMPHASRLRDTNRQPMIEQWRNPREEWAKKAKKLLQPILHNLTKAYLSASNWKPTQDADINHLVAQLEGFRSVVVIPQMATYRGRLFHRNSLQMAYACVRADKMAHHMEVKNDSSIRFANRVVKFTRVLVMNKDFDLFGRLLPTLARCKGKLLTIIAYGQTGSGNTHVMA